MVDLIDEAFQLQAFLETNACRFCFIGGLAVQWWGEPRLTRDIDVSLLTGFGDEPRFIDLLTNAYAGRIEGVQEFARTNRVLLLRTMRGVGIDIALAALPFEELAIERAVPAELVPGKALKLCSAEDLIVYKLFAGREIDYRDARSVMVRQGDERLNWTYVEAQLTELGELRDDSSLLGRMRDMRNALRRDTAP